MIWAWDINITADTLEASPKTQILKMSKGVIVKVEFKFLAGCHGMVKARLRRGESQLVPLSRDEWITGDDEAVSFSEYFELKTTPYQLKFIGCSPDTKWPHKVTVRISVLPSNIAAPYTILKGMVDSFKRLIGL